MSNRLPETEVANIAFLPVGQKRRALEAFERPKSIKGSYEPFRRVFPDAINQQFPLFGEGLPQSTWKDLEQRLRVECRGSQQLIDMNSAIAQSTFNYATLNRVSANAIDVVPLRFSSAIVYSFGLEVIVRYPSRAAIVFLDMRRSKNLSTSGQMFMQSALHHRFRVAYPDFANLDLEIWRYRDNKERTLIPQALEAELKTYDEIVSDVLETHAIWESVKRGSGESRRAVGGGGGPLFD